MNEKKTLHTWIDPSSSSSFWRIVYGPAPAGMGVEFDSGDGTGWRPWTPTQTTLLKEILRLVRDVEVLSARVIAAMARATAAEGDREMAVGHAEAADDAISQLRERLTAAERTLAQARRALSAYRSAMLCGELETPQLKAEYIAALAAGNATTGGTT